MNRIIEDYIAVSFAYKILLPESCHPLHKRIDLAGEILIPGTIELHRDIRHSICRVAFLSPEQTSGLHISILYPIGEILLYERRLSRSLYAERTDTNRKNDTLRNTCYLLRIIVSTLHDGKKRSIVRVRLLNPVGRIQGIVRSHMVVVEVIITQPPRLFPGDPRSEDRRWEILVTAA